MSTINDVKRSGQQLIELECCMSFLTFHGSDPKIIEELENLDEVFKQRKQIAKEANNRFQAVGKQICEDHGVKWATADTESIDRNTVLSEAAEAKFQEYIKFINQL